PLFSIYGFKRRLAFKDQSINQRIRMFPN
ncbi:hypothetical protein NCCP133_32090, partial [Cytobacillus sp. NCCP-133]